MRKLFDKPEDWSKEIQAAFYEEFPFFTSFPIKVNLARKDLKRGFAIGSITLNPAFSIPVIIDNFVLKDFDIANLNGKIVPLTGESLIDIFSNPSAFKATGENMDDSKLTRLFNPTLTYPNDDGSRGSDTGVRYTKTAMLQEVLPYVTKENQDKVATLFTPEDLASFKKHGTLGMLEDLLTCEPMQEKDFNKIAQENLSTDYTFFYKVGEDRYNAYFMNSAVDYKEKVTVNEEEKDTLQMKLAKKKCKKKKGKSKLTMKKAELERGSDGMVSDGDTHIKIAVTNVLDNNEGVTIEGLTKHLQHVKLDVSHVNKIEKVAENHYLVPKNYEFFELGLEGGDNDLVDTSNRVIKDGVTGNYTFQGPVFSKYAENNHTIYNVPAEQAFVMAAHCGASAEDVIKMANLQRDTPMYFEESELDCPVPIDEFVEKLALASEKDKVELGIIEEHLPNVIKLAAKLEDEFIVDKVLSLGAVNDRSVKEFVAYIPALEEASQYLARLLMLVRLGQKGVPEADVEQAMESLTKVVWHLKNLANTAKNTKELTR